ncbi:unnamed protein product [Musa acuminata subsp. burmannicoides]
MKISNLGMKSICSPLPWVQSFRTGKKGLRSNVIAVKHDKEGEQQNHNIPGAGKFRPEGSLGTIAAGWFCTRAKKASEGSEKTISSYVSATTGFLIDWGPLSSSGNNFSCPDANRNTLLGLFTDQSNPATRDRTGLSRRKKRERERESWEKQREGVRNCGCQPLGLSSVKARRRRRSRMEREGSCQEGLGKTMDEKEKEGERQREGRRGGRGEKHEGGGGKEEGAVGDARLNGTATKEEGERYREGRGNKHGGGEERGRQGGSTGTTTGEEREKERRKAQSRE